MHSRWEKAALQKAADQVVVRGTLKVSGIAATIFGALAVFASVMPPLDPLLLFVGGVLALVGLWNLTNPSPLGLALTAGALVLVGFYNVGSGFLDTAAGAKPFVVWQVMGVWQVIWGIQGFRRWKRFQNTFDATVSDEQRTRAKAMIQELRKSNPRNAPDVIELVAGGKPIRARLMQDMALLLISGEDVQFVARHDLEIEASAPALGRSVKVTLRRDGQSATGTIPSEGWQRFRTWKQSSMGLQQQRAA